MKNNTLALKIKERDQDLRAKEVKIDQLAKRIEDLERSRLLEGDVSQNRFSPHSEAKSPYDRPRTRSPMRHVILLPS